jgi:HEPN domain-containing protein
LNNIQYAQSLLKQAIIILDEAKMLKEKKFWNLVIRRCQEAVELALKSSLIFVGIQPPRVHDVGPILKEHSEKFPLEFRQHIPRLASISRSLRAEREISFYGDDISGLSPETLYTSDDAEEVLEKAKFVIEKCQELIFKTKYSKI